MEQTLLLIVIVLVFILVLFLGALTIIGMKFLKLKESQKNQIAPTEKLEEKVEEKEVFKKVSPEVLKSLRSNAKYQTQKAYCVDHASEISVGVCSISGESYCEHCLATYNNMKFAKKFLDIYLSSDWPELTTIAETIGNKDLIERIYKAKKELWLERALPVIVQGQYKINIDTDEIESFVVILTRIEDQETIKNEFSFIHT